ncbi:MAG TPA: potassium transporter Kup [Cellvibrio sp.]|nr:potassium transporter Kup [Cellvibrio sp.]
MSSQPTAQKSTHLALTIAALGVVFGDIGTSPLYALKETFNPKYGIPLTELTVLGGLSSVLWALMLVVSLKYVVLVMRADNHGEGGTMSLLALGLKSISDQPHWKPFLIVLGVLGTSLFFGDAVITPAMTVLSALEGLAVVEHSFTPYIMPIAIGIVIGIFALQRKGTSKVGAIFGPVTIIWFLVLSASGIYGIVQNPVVFKALNPIYAFHFLTDHGLASFLILGAVVLAVTGVESLYGDMGHFGKSPIRTAWFALVFPSLVINYFGQGAIILLDPTTIDNPFYKLFPAWALYPAIALATCAAVIASQACIAGTYSLTKQAVQLGFLPRLKVVQTSASEIGQIYLPGVTMLMMVVVVLIVLTFKTSSALAFAYGVAVTGGMMITSTLTFFVIYYGWKLPLWLCIAATSLFLTIDIALFSACFIKVFNGGWLPVLIAVLVLTIMLTWRRGREVLFNRLRSSSVPLDVLLPSLFISPPHRVPGTAIFLTATPEATPHALLHNLNHNKVLHERVVFLTVDVTNSPWIDMKDACEVQDMGNNCFRVIIHFGFMNQPDITQALKACEPKGLTFNMMETSFFLSREKIVPVATIESGMPMWREHLFAAMARNAGTAVDHFNIPTNRVIELGTQVEI